VGISNENLHDKYRLLHVTYHVHGVVLSCTFILSHNLLARNKNLDKHVKAFPRSMANKVYYDIIFEFFCVRRQKPNVVEIKKSYYKYSLYDSTVNVMQLFLMNSMAVGWH
jgi:hypothetical protein